MINQIKDEELKDLNELSVTMSLEGEKKRGEYPIRGFGDLIKEIIEEVNKKLEFDVLVKTASGDLEADYLSNKLVEGDNITLTVVDTDGVKTLKIDAIGGNSGAISIYNFPSLDASVEDVTVNKTILANTIADGKYMMNVSLIQQSPRSDSTMNNGDFSIVCGTFNEQRSFYNDGVISFMFPIEIIEDEDIVIGFTAYNAGEGNLDYINISLTPISTEIDIDPT